MGSDTKKVLVIDPTLHPKPGSYFIKGEPEYTRNAEKPMQMDLFNPASFPKRATKAGRITLAEDQVIELGSHESKYGNGCFVVIGDFIKQKVEPKLRAERDAYKSNYEKAHQQLVMLTTTSDDAVLKHMLLETTEFLRELENKNKQITIAAPEKK